MYQEPAVQSPCIGVCILNEEDVCVGCYRTALEITDWVMFTDEQKVTVLERCEQRSRE